MYTRASGNATSAEFLQQSLMDQSRTEPSLLLVICLNWTLICSNNENWGPLFDSSGYFMLYTLKVTHISYFFLDSLRVCWSVLFTCMSVLSGLKATEAHGSLIAVSTGGTGPLQEKVCENVTLPALVCCRHDLSPVTCQSGSQVQVLPLLMHVHKTCYTL